MFLGDAAVTQSPNELDLLNGEERLAGLDLRSHRWQREAERGPSVGLVLVTSFSGVSVERTVGETMMLTQISLLLLEASKRGQRNGQ